LGAYEFVGAPPAGIFADLNGDGEVNISDLGMMLAAFGKTGAGLAGALFPNANRSSANEVMIIFTVSLLCIADDRAQPTPTPTPTAGRSR
jgi:hypothetical protein